MGEKHTLSCTVENHFGVLARMATLISARGFNIDSLTVSATGDPTVSHMTIVVDADALKLEQVKRQLNRLVDVIDVKELKDNEFVGRDLLLARVSVTEKTKGELKTLAKRFEAKLSDISDSSVVIEVAGKTQELNQLIEQLRKFEITRLVRTGRVCLEK